MNIEPDVSGAVKRVKEYIVDAHEWESNSFVERTPQLERELKDGRNKWIATGLPPFSESVLQQFRENGMKMLKKRTESKESLQLLGEKHWVGNAYFTELDVAVSSSKHDPRFECVVDAKMVEPTRAKVVTAMCGGFLEGMRRTYSVEKDDSGWRIRSYNIANQRLHLGTQRNDARAIKGICNLACGFWYLRTSWHTAARAWSFRRCGSLRVS